MTRSWAQPIDFAGILCAHIEILTKIGWRFHGRKGEKVESRWKIDLFAKGTRKKLATEREKMIWKVLVVHDRKYHLFLTPGEGREKVVGAWKRVQKSKINVTEYFFFRTGHHGVARKLLPLTLESFWSGPRAPGI